MIYWCLQRDNSLTLSLSLTVENVVTFYDVSGFFNNSCSRRSSAEADVDISAWCLEKWLECSLLTECLLFNFRVTLTQEFADLNGGKDCGFCRLCCEIFGNRKL